MISVNAIGIKAMRKSAGALGKGMKKRRTVNGRAVLIVDRWIQKNFQSEGEKVGGWEPLAESTILARRTSTKKRKGNKILQDTGQLKTRWKHYWSHKYAKITSNVPYAVYHDSDKPRKGNLPRRQILPDAKHIMPQLKKVYNHFVKTQIKRSGLKK